MAFPSLLPGSSVIQPVLLGDQQVPLYGWGCFRSVCCFVIPLWLSSQQSYPKWRARMFSSSSKMSWDLQSESSSSAVLGQMLRLGSFVIQTAHSWPQGLLCKVSLWIGIAEPGVGCGLLSSSDVLNLKWKGAVGSLSIFNTLKALQQMCPRREHINCNPACGLPRIRVRKCCPTSIHPLS